MATSTFGKQFSIRSEKTNEFVREMTRKVAPTLKRGFNSKLTHEKDLRSTLLKALK